MSISNKLSITDLDLTSKKVLIRVDFNVPIQDGKITNPAVGRPPSSIPILLIRAIQRIVAALPTIKYALENRMYARDASDLRSPDEIQRLPQSSSCPISAAQMAKL